MKKLLFILLLFASCADEPFLSPTPEKDTTLEVVNSIDTSQTYYVTMIGGNSADDGTLYVLNKDKVVVYKAVNYSGRVDSILFFALLGLVAIMIFILVVATD